MQVISISIEKSKDEITQGIPKSVIITTNIPSTIFYTLDGTDPTMFSEIYTSKIFFSREKSFIEIKIMATNGVDTSPIISEKYFTSLINKNIRQFNSGTTEPPQEYANSTFPFSSSSPSPEVIFNASVSDHQSISDGSPGMYSNGFNADGYPTNFTKLPYNSQNYQIKYPRSEYRGVGTLPFKSMIEKKTPPPQETLRFSKTFDPRAMVIFQDTDKENPEDPPQINKQFFTLDDKISKTKGGAHFFVAGNETPPMSGTFLRSHYNPRTNKMTYYYLDTQSLRWIISTQDYVPNSKFDEDVGGFFSRGIGVGKVFKWQLYGRRHLF